MTAARKGHVDVVKTLITEQAILDLKSKVCHFIHMLLPVLDLEGVWET